MNKWINLANDNVYQIANLKNEYVLTDNIDLTIRILKSLDNDFHQHQVIPKDEIVDFFEGREQIILHSWEEYQIIMGHPIDNQNFDCKRQDAKRKMKDRMVENDI